MGTVFLKGIWGCSVKTADGQAYPLRPSAATNFDKFTCARVTNANRRVKGGESEQKTIPPPPPPSPKVARPQEDYFHYLGRAADQNGVDFWINQFAHGQTNENLITLFVASDEYFASHSN
jgi:hypothetical protein